jgi:hypothetical protein
MDTTTVLEIIEMIENRILNHSIDTLNASTATTVAQACMSIGKREAFKEIRDYLQGYIESQLNAHEMNTEEG